LPSGVYTACPFIPAASSSPHLIIPIIIHPHQAIGITTAYAGDYFIFPCLYLHLFYPLKPAFSHDNDSFAFAAVLAIDFFHCFVLPIASPHSSVLRSLSSYGLVIFTVHCANALLLRASRFLPFFDYRFRPLTEGPGETSTFKPVLVTRLTVILFASSSSSSAALGQQTLVRLRIVTLLFPTQQVPGSLHSSKAPDLGSTATFHTPFLTNNLLASLPILRYDILDHIRSSPSTFFESKSFAPFTVLGNTIPSSSLIPSTFSLVLRNYRIPGPIAIALRHLSQESAGHFNHFSPTSEHTHL
jgi:hypothetical protein